MPVDESDETAGFGCWGWQDDIPAGVVLMTLQTSVPPPPPPDVYIKTLIPSMLVLRGRDFVNGISALIG